MNRQTETSTTPDQQGEDLSSLLNYPSLGKLFDPHTTAAELPRMKQQLSATVQNLERVQRQGSAQDAARAAHIAQAFHTTLKFLDELEALGKAATK